MEEVALINFINARPPGNILREIAERTLCDLRRMENRVDPVKIVYGWHPQIKCYNRISGERYISLGRAARRMKISPGKLKYDIFSKKFKYNIVPV